MRRRETQLLERVHCTPSLDEPQVWGLGVGGWCLVFGVWGSYLVVCGLCLVPLSVDACMHVQAGAQALAALMAELSPGGVSHACNVMHVTCV